MANTQDLQTALAHILDRAIDVTAADFGNIQLFFPKDGSLRMSVQRGFDTRFVQFFRVVKNDLTACAAALEQGCRVVVRDVRRSRKFTESTRRELLKAGVHAVQSTPVQSSSGEVLAMINTHFSSVHTPTREQLRRLDVVARHARDVIEAAREPERAADLTQTIDEFRDSRPAKLHIVRGESPKQ